MDSELSEELAEELITKHFESPELDYKLTFDAAKTGSWMEIAKDVYGMANFGGGQIVFGVEDGTFKPVGFDLTFHIDSQEWVNRLSKWVSSAVRISYLEHISSISGIDRKYPILHIYPTKSSLLIPKCDGVYNDPSGKAVTAFRNGVIYTRTVSGTVAATGEEFWKLHLSLLSRSSSEGSIETPLEVISVLNKKAEPDCVEEKLWFNLFPVTEVPDFVYEAESKCRNAQEVYDQIALHLSESREKRIPAFFLADKKIYTFAPFDFENPLIHVIGSSRAKIATEKWLTDINGQHKLTMLLNFNLKELCHQRGFYYDRKRDRYFIEYHGGLLPEVVWKPYKSTATRQLVQEKLKKSGELLYYEHFAARMRFIILSKGIYLIIEPLRVLTINGIDPLDPRLNTRISTRKNVLYHNNNYLYDVKLILHILGGNRNEVHLGSRNSKVSISMLPITSLVDFGILDDQHTGEDFLDSLKSEPFDYMITEDDLENDNPLTETSLEE